MLLVSFSLRNSGHFALTRPALFELEKVRLRYDNSSHHMPNRQFYTAIIIPVLFVPRQINLLLKLNKIIIGLSTVNFTASTLNLIITCAQKSFITTQDTPPVVKFLTSDWSFSMSYLYGQFNTYQQLYHTDDTY